MCSTNCVHHQLLSSRGMGPMINRLFHNYRVDTISSIFRIMRTHSVANDNALVLTSIGCTTFSSNILVICPFLTLMPVFIWKNKRVPVSSSSQQTWKSESLPTRQPGKAKCRPTEHTSPFACRLRSSVTIAIGFKPAFSASVKGITYITKRFKQGISSKLLGHYREEGAE